MVRTGVVRMLVFISVVLTPLACDPPEGEGGDHDRSARTESDGPTSTVIWGCEYAIPSKVDKLDPRWREDSIVVGDLGFEVDNFTHSAWRPHEEADLQFKLPVVIEGHSGTTVWVPDHERDRVALILSDVPRRGPGNTYRVEDGHQGVRFEPCADKEWSAWVAGLALADRRESVLNVKVDGAPRPTRVSLGPWVCEPTAVQTADCVIK
jgi:hypothetical protein